MTHKDIFAAFLNELGVQKEDVISWYPNGHNSIRVAVKSSLFKGDFAFTYESIGCWIFETMDHYVKRLKEGGVKFR